MTEALVKLTGVTKQFGAAAPALDGISGEIRAGEITGLVGPDGAGKTTLIRLITGLMAAEQGSIEVLGFNSADDPASIQTAIGYMPQRFGLYEDLSVEENLTLYADLRALPASDRAATFDELLAFTDLRPFTARRAGQLSGGMKQKLGLACALMRKPRLLLLDEPSVGVDPISRRELWRMVSGLKAGGVGVVWATAYLDEAQACDHVLLLDRGKLLFDGLPGDLTRRTQGRVFRMVDIEGRRRPVLAATLALPGVIDGVIQGSAIRIVTRAGAEPPRPVPAAGPTPGWWPSRRASKTRSSTSWGAARAVNPSSPTRRPPSPIRTSLYQARNSPSASVTSPRRRTFHSKWRGGRSSGFSGPTARASRRRSGCCAGSSSPPPARDASLASTCATIPRASANAWATWRRSSRCTAISALDRT